MLFSSLLFLLAAEPSIHLERLPITVNRPVDARFAPHTDKYLYICEHFGKVRVVVNGLLRFEPFLDIDYLTTDQVEQAGLLSIAFSPDFKRDKTFWVCYIDNNLDQVIARYTAKKFTKAKRKGDIIFTMFLAMSIRLHQLAPESRELSVAMTHMETANFWANAAIARNE